MPNRAAQLKRRLRALFHGGAIDGELNEEIRQHLELEAEELSGAQALAKKLEAVALAFAVKTGEGGKMFGAITSADINDKLAAAGFAIERKKILLFTPVKALGRHTVKVKLHADVSVELSFDVVSENPIVAAVEEKKPEAEPYEDRRGEWKRPDTKRTPRRPGGKG